jgi:phosphopantothenoylcysteine decarboxylase/phosphopantothenate--cysteine ligase
MHPSRAIASTTSTHLEGTRIALAVTGSIAAVQTVKLARELIRHGAEVVPYATEAALDLIQPAALEWATGHEPVTELTGQVEHLAGATGGVDAVLVAPATANTVAKTALAVDDTPVTSLAGASLGNVPVLVAPAMHDEMADREATREHLATLEDEGARIVDPMHEEGEAKMAPIEAIVEHVLAELGPAPLAGDRVLVLAGSTVEDIDAMRVVTNKSTGRTGAALAREAARLGAEVTLWFGHGHTELPPTVEVERFVTVEDLVDRAPDAGDHDWVLVPAAISDFKGATAEGKRSSGSEQTLDLVPTPKVLPHLREVLDEHGGRLVAFKAEAGEDEDALVDEATRFAKQNRADAVVANRLEDVDVDRTRVHLVRESAPAEAFEGSKQAVARDLLERLAEVL